VGFVRWENVIKGGVAYREYFCGHCERSWRVADSEQEGRRDSGEHRIKPNDDEYR
jgi:hypothetical protein